MNKWFYIEFVLDLLFGTVVISLIGKVLGLPFWVIMILGMLYGWYIGKKTANKLNNQKDK